MKAQDLRIGNIIQGQGPQTVKSISEYGEADGYRYLITVEENRNQYKEIEVAGIPLSPEWLERAGFKMELYDEEVWYELYSGPWAFIQGDKNGFTEVTLEGYEDSLRVRYVHQLQNLYFALCAQELTFTQND